MVSQAQPGALLREGEAEGEGWVFWERQGYFKGARGGAAFIFPPAARRASRWGALQHPAHPADLRNREWDGHGLGPPVAGAPCNSGPQAP